MSRFTQVCAGTISLLALAGPSMAQNAGHFAEPVLTLSGQLRVRYDDFDNRQLMAGQDEPPLES